MYIFIINPEAGNGKAKRIHETLQHSESYQKLYPVCYSTQYKGHAEELVEHLQVIHEKKDIHAIVVIGGDGTMHEVLNGLSNRQIPVAFVPGGSGNDFGRGISVSKNPEVIIEAVLKNSHTIDYWLGVYDLHQRKRKYFVNCLGFGFDAVVAKSANQFTFKKLFNRLQLGSIIYLIALLRELIFFKPTQITMDLDGDLIQFDRCFLLTVNNHPFFGGGMKINPSAENNEQNFSIMVVDSISKWKVLALFGTVFSGKHLNFKEVHTFIAAEISITSDIPIPYQSDGETGTAHYARITKKATPVKVLGSNKKQRQKSAVI